MLVKRTLLFLVGCMGARFGLAWLAYKNRANLKVLKIMGLLALVPAIGFTLIYVMGWRKTGAEVMPNLGGKLWWNDLRPVHALLYTMFAFLVLLHTQYAAHAWIALVADATLGLLAFVVARLVMRIP